MDSPAHFSVPAGDESLLWNQAPPSAASSSRYYDESQDLQPENEGDRTVRLQQVQLAQDSSAMNSQRQDDTFAFKGTMGSAPDPETPVVHSTSPSSNEDEHVTRLRTERDRLRGMNDSLERTILHFEGARSQLDRLQSNISTTQGLMRLWSELMSQTEHTRGLVMDTGWTMDGDLDFLQAEQEREERERQAEQSEKERILREAQEEEERRKAEAAAAQEAQKSRGQVPARVYCLLAVADGVPNLFRDPRVSWIKN